MKFKTTLLLILAVSFFGNCAELFGKKDKGNDDEILLLALAAGQRCPTSEVTSPTPGTRYDFQNCSAADSNLALQGTGFVPRNVTLSAGLVGTSGASNVSTVGSALSNTGGTKKASVEVVYQLNSASSYLQVHLIGTSNFNGPGFRLNPTGAQKLVDTVPSTLGAGPAWASSVSTDKTLCLEVHEEGAGAHIFGWQGTCASVDRGAYEFEEENVNIPSGLGGDKVGLILNNATVKSLTIYRQNIGTAGSFF